MPLRDARPRVQTKNLCGRQLLLWGAYGSCCYGEHTVCRGGFCRAHGTPGEDACGVVSVRVRGTRTPKCFCIVARNYQISTTFACLRLLCNQHSYGDMPAGGFPAREHGIPAGYAARTVWPLYAGKFHREQKKRQPRNRKIPGAPFSRCFSVCHGSYSPQKENCLSDAKQILLLNRTPCLRCENKKLR